MILCLLIQNWLAKEKKAAKKAGGCFANVLRKTIEIPTQKRSFQAKPLNYLSNSIAFKQTIEKHTQSVGFKQHRCNTWAKQQISSKISEQTFNYTKHMCLIKAV